MIPILLSLSHSSRAYISHAKGLQGFLPSANHMIVNALTNAHISGILLEKSKWQSIDFQSILDELKKIPTALGKANYLAKGYPVLYTYVM